ncbi:MAG: hypothetical protein C0505_19505 [Leptothrix sp. (in: Bacteria)]|nr:hypothetical protein [Leptothrix sp. (in: b-proteobacteria)]
MRMTVILNTNILRLSVTTDRAPRVDPPHSLRQAVPRRPHAPRPRAAPPPQHPRLDPRPFTHRAGRPGPVGPARTWRRHGAAA